MSTVRNTGRHYVPTQFGNLLFIFLPVSVKLGFPELQGSTEGCRGFRGTKIRDAGKVLLAVLNLCVRFQIRVATFDTNHSVTDSTQSVSQSVSRCFNPEAP